MTKKWYPPLDFHAHVSKHISAFAGKRELIVPATLNAGGKPINKIAKYSSTLISSGDC